MNVTHADLVLIGGLVTTMADGDGSEEEAQAIAISGDRIAAVGTNEEIEAWVGPGTERIDLSGRRVIPGLIDAHVHFARAGFTWNDEVRWGTVRSLEEGLDLIARRADEVPAGTWIRVIGGWSPAQFAENRHPTLDDIDRVAPDHPVFVQYLYEYGLLNSEARARVPLERAVDEGVDASTVDVDESGRPTGVIRTLPSLKWLYAQLPVPAFEEQVASTAAAGHEFVSFGVTGVIDGGGANTGADVYRPIFETWRRGELIPRVRLTMHSSGAGEEETEVGGYLRFQHPRLGDDVLSVLGVGEIVMWPFHDDFGRPPSATDDDVTRLEELLRRCAEAGWTVQMHLMHPETTDLVIDLWSQIHADTPIDGLRWSIVHGQSITPDHTARLAGMGCGVISEALLRMGGEHAIEIWGEDRVAFAPHIRKLQEEGIRVAVGSDGLRVATYNPFATLQWLITGRSLAGAQIWDAGNVLDRHEALALLTREAAWFSFEEDTRGRIQPGYLADLAVLSDDYFSVPDTELPEIRSAMTLVGGRVVWDAAARTGRNGR